MKKLSFLGIGPKIAAIILPWLAASIILSSTMKPYFAFGPDSNHYLLAAGIVLMIAGLVFYASTVRSLLKGLNETKLMTTGAFSLCQNPLYASITILIIPALSMILNSWLVLTTSAAGYLIFKIFIRKEYLQLEEFFGEEYMKYKSETPEFFPIPVKKWLTRR